MPMGPLLNCPVCRRVGCVIHPRGSGWAGRPYPDRTPRQRGRALQTARARLFAQEPWCRRCRAAGRQTIATIRDHLVPLAEGGRDDDRNVQPLCRSCSDAKTHHERQRGRERR